MVRFRNKFLFPKYLKVFNYNKYIQPNEYSYEPSRYDYEYSDIFDFSKGINFQKLAELSPVDFNKTILYQSPSTNISNISNKSAINISFDLSKIISPEKYRVYFTAEAYVLNEDGTYCGIIDVTLPIPIPRPTFNINTIPSFISLREGETKDIRIEVNSSLPVASIVSLNKYKLFETDSSITRNFSINKIRLEPYAFNTSVLHIHALENSKPQLYSIPIEAYWNWNMTHPTTKDPKGFSEVVTKKIIVMIEEYPIQQQINDFTKGIHAIWKDNEGIIIFLVGIVLTPFGAWIFDKIIKRKKKRNNKI